ncbi:MAG: hypothetical protein V1679_02130, partial [Candidatus Peregrinibacteria bacterium]
RCIKKDEYKCTLGGTSLALVGLLDLVEVYPSLEGKYLGLIEDYKEHILAMKKDGKGFIESYYLDKRKNDNESSFSNGEALYALVRYYQYEVDRKVRDVIADSLEYFLEVYREKWDANFYLWGMVALKDWYGIDPRDEYFEFVKDYTDWRISKYKGMRTTSNNKCAYIEGVVSAYSVLGKVLSDEELAYYLEEIEFWFKKGKELQISEGDFFRVSLNNGRIYGVQVEDWNKSEGGFLTSIKEPVQRIDFTQHCLSGYLQKLVDVDGEGL